MQSKRKVTKCKYLSQEDYENILLMVGILIGQDRVQAPEMKKMLGRLKLLLDTQKK